MRFLFDIDTKNYNPNGTQRVRPSVRAIIIRKNKLALIYSKKYNQYYFPGGGLQYGETQQEALIRETLEETGLSVLPESIREYGLVHAVQAGSAEDMFVQDNLYFLCDVKQGAGAQQLDDYEREEGFTLEFVTPKHALAVNRAALNKTPDSGVMQREVKLLETLIEEGYFGEPIEKPQRVNEKPSARAILRATREVRVKSGHPWVFNTDVETVSGEFEPGDVVTVESSKGAFLGKAFYNPNSKISLRMLTYRDEPIDAEFFRQRVQTAWEYRRKFADINSCRLIYSESDFLPGLIVDKFADILVIQSMSLGIERQKDAIVRALVDIVKPKGIYERSDVPVRHLEGMEEFTGLLWGEVPAQVEMRENGITFMVDVINGQKTGFFLDQKENRREVMHLCKGSRVLDCFTHNGSFALHAAKGGANDVLGVDISEEAVVVATENARINGFEQVRFETHNCFDHLRELTEAKEKFDVVILDPPAFTKSRARIENALRGYKEINLRGLKLVRNAGFLVSCSCSQHVSEEQFIAMINEAAKETGRRIRFVEMRTQGHDHPILPAAPETKYLKCAILQVFD